MEFGSNVEMRRVSSEAEEFLKKFFTTRSRCS